ncbi:hypothetical protein LX36DRAFT_674108 [Colletotrichum falcatum]|nr:hypothetical protein LX36DRAFT_674108 [Colletotrichum falcatum]
MRAARTKVVLGGAAGAVYFMPKHGTSQAGETVMEQSVVGGNGAEKTEWLASNGSFDIPPTCHARSPARNGRETDWGPRNQPTGSKDVGTLAARLPPALVLLLLLLLL